MGINIAGSSRLSFFTQVFLRVSFEPIHTGLAAEMIGLSLIFRMEFGIGADIHAADGIFGRGGFGRRLITLPYILLGICYEFVQAMLAAKVVGCPLILTVELRVGSDIHTANGIFHGSQLS
jgi:hypothetical protein